MSTELKSLRVAKEGGIAEVTLMGPGKGNALGPDFWREMPPLFAGLDSDESVRAIILRGQGAHFSYGLDLKAMVEDLDLVADEGSSVAARTRLLDRVGEMQAACDRVAECRKPVIAAVSGWCIGAGLDLIAACDIRLCSAEARFSLREVKLAIIADLGSLQRLPPIIGEGNTRELAFTGRNIDAARALRMGLVNEVYATPELLIDAARRMAEEIASNPPLVVQGIKQVMNYCADKSVADGLRYVALWNSAFIQSRDLGEAIAAFRERREAKFEGR